MISLFTAIIPIVLPILGWFLDRSKASADAKASFYAFVQKAGNDFGSKKLMDLGDSQLAFLKASGWKETV